MACEPEKGRRGENQAKKKPYSEAPVPRALKLLSSSLMIRMIIHAAHLRVT